MLFRSSIALGQSCTELQGDGTAVQISYSTGTITLSSDTVATYQLGGTATYLGATCQYNVNGTINKVGG